MSYVHSVDHLRSGLLSVNKPTCLLGGNGGGMMMKKAFSQPAVFVVGPLTGNRVIMESECALAGMVRGD